MVFDRVRDLAGGGNEEDEATPYECHGCGAGHQVQHHVCPECGSFNVERAEW